VEDEAVRRFGNEASAEAKSAQATGVAASGSAFLLAAALESGDESAAAFQVLVDPAATPASHAGALAIADAVLGQFTDRFISTFDPQIGPVLFVNVDRGLKVGVFADQAVALELAGNPVVGEALRQPNGVQSVVVAGSQAFGVAAESVAAQQPGGPVNFGAIVVASKLDDSYLQARVEGDRSGIEGYGLALATRDQIVAGFGGESPLRNVLSLSRRVMDTQQGVTGFAGGRFLAVEPVLGADDVPAMAMVVSVPTSAIDETRADLFRVLFLVALGSTLVAVLLAAVVGERIGSGLRRLTAAAGELQRGNLGARAEVAREDELGVLGTTFDSMAGSLQTMTAELRQAADHEASLRGRLETVVAGMGEALVAVDDRGEITDFNAAAGQLCGVINRKAVGRRVDQVVRLATEDGTDLTHRLIEPVGEGWTLSAVVLRADGSEVPVVLSSGSLRGASGEPGGAVFVLRDVRREREVERMKT
ncbi:MAG: HAMP domain-containing protein, partial [Acidimicrobiales bacterium]